MSDKKYFGLLAEFENPQILYTACEKVRDAQYKNWDAHTPFPVHGLDKAMGLKPSILPWIVLVMGLTGASIGFGWQAWVHAWEYPLNLAGKAIFAWPTTIPITFELGVLFGALSAVFGMIVINGLPRWHHPLFQSERFKRATDDRFFISIESQDPLFDATQTAQFLKEIGAIGTELLEED